MRRTILCAFSTLTLAVTLLATPATLVAHFDFDKTFRPIFRRPVPVNAFKGTLDFARTELFFGTAKPDGTSVTDAEFLTFLDEQVTPRFPDGLTLLKGDGQFRLSTGEIIKEDSFLLILLFPVEDFKDASRKIEAIRSLYKTAFEQESVLRVDNPFAVRVSF
jgi:hypothetical protein